MNIIEARNLSYKYSQRNEYAVDDISFSIEKGSYTAIVGLNGSGKSTLSRMLCGLLEPTKGEVIWNENPRIGIVFQSPKEQIVSGVVYRDTEFGPLNLHLTPDEVELRTIESLNAVDMLSRSGSSTSEISLGQTQKVALAGIMALNPDVLIMDEAISMLDPASRQDIYELMRYLHRHGNTIIHITHDVEAILEADNIIGMEKGKIYYSGSKDDFISDDEKFSKVKGKTLPVTDKKQFFAFADKEVSFSVKSLNFNYDKTSKISNVSFELFKGTLTALTGPSGAGKSTVLELCSGLLRPKSGTICIAGSKNNNTKKKIQRPVLAQQNASAALFENFAADDVSFGPKNKGIKGDELVTLVKNSMNQAALPFEEFADRNTFCLSGGEQRRLAIAGILAMNSEVILFDEPTAGLDCEARYKVLQMMRNLAEQGKTVLFSTHKTDEADFADREIRIERGKVFLDTAEEFLEDKKDMQNKDDVQPYDGISILESLRVTSTTLSRIDSYEKTIMQKTPAWFRILYFLLLFITVLCAKTFLFCITMFVIMLAYCKLSGFKLRSLFRLCIKLLPFLLIFAFLQLMFHPFSPEEIQYTSWKYLTITPSKIWFCTNSLIRTFTSLGIICGFFISTPEYDLIDGLKILLKPLEVIKIPVRYLILLMEVIFRFIPLLVDETISIIKTQLIRGGLGKVKGKMARIRAVIPLIVPMFIQTIKRSEALADAITVRCFK